MIESLQDGPCELVKFETEAGSQQPPRIHEINRHRVCYDHLDPDMDSGSGSSSPRLTPSSDMSESKSPMVSAPAAIPDPTSALFMKLRQISPSPKITYAYRITAWGFIAVCTIESHDKVWTFTGAIPSHSKKDARRVVSHEALDHIDAIMEIVPTNSITSTTDHINYVGLYSFTTLVIIS